MSTLKKVSYTNEDGEYITVFLPHHYVVCSECEGNGTHLNSSMKSHAYSMEEFNQEFDDEQSRQYFKHGGIYDVVCDTCKGKRVIEVLDDEACVGVYHEHYEEYVKYCDEKLQYEKMYELEKRTENYYY